MQTRIVPITVSIVIAVGFVVAGSWALYRSDRDAAGVKDSGAGDEASGPLPRIRPPTKERKLDAADSEWQSEAFAGAAEKRLKAIAALLLHGTAIDDDDLEEFAARDCAAGPLRPHPLQQVFSKDNIEVFRSAPADQESAPEEKTLADALLELRRPFLDTRPTRVNLKVISVDLQENRATTRIRYEASGKSSSGIVQQRGLWSVEWQLVPEQGPLVQHIRSLDFEEAIKTDGSEPWFADCTQHVVGDNDSFRRQLAFGLTHWFGRLEWVRGSRYFARNGIAVGDVNSDGLEDVYVCQLGGLPNRLFLQMPDGRVVDRSSQFGVDWLDHTTSALFLDLDNDADQDLVLATNVGLVFLENLGTRFRNAGRLPLRENDAHALSAVDYDADGDLDLYVTVDSASAGTRQRDALPSFVYHDANDGGRNALIRNDIEPAKSWRFTDVTEEVGLDVRNRRHSLAAAWEDFDNDGDQDLYVANDYGENCLYRNDDGQFVEVAAELGVVDRGAGMSVSWADIDHDGWMDLYVGNMFSSAGSRITTQKRFLSRATDDVRLTYRRFSKGNSLFRSVAGKRFEEIGPSAAVEMGRWAWSSIFVDLNNDSWDDLLVANGYITTEDTGDL